MSVAEQAKQFYQTQLQQELEAKHPGDFVAIEPSSKSPYVAKEFVDAALAARKAHPNCQPFVIRVGKSAALCL